VRRASVGTFYAAITEPEGRLVARSPCFDAGDALAEGHVRRELARVLRALGWRRLEGPACRFERD
jgi:hypothetical protein